MKRKKTKKDQEKGKIKVYRKNKKCFGFQRKGPLTRG